jgi:hypothetical protein
MVMGTFAGKILGEIIERVFFLTGIPMRVRRNFRYILIWRLILDVIFHVRCVHNRCQRTIKGLNKAA